MTRRNNPPSTEHVWITYKIEGHFEHKILGRIAYLRKCSHEGCKVMQLLDENSVVVKVYDRRRARKY